MAKKLTGRPSKYSKLLADEITKRLSEGQSLVRICRDKHMPTRPTVYNWLLKYPTFFNKYAHARELQADYFVDEMLEIADDTTGDWRTSEKGKNIPGHNHVHRSRLQVDTRKWIAARLYPKKYSDRIKQEHTGREGEPIQHQGQVKIYIPDNGRD